MYAKTARSGGEGDNAPPGGDGAGAAGGGARHDDVVDADFEEVKE